MLNINIISFECFSAESVASRGFGTAQCQRVKSNLCGYCSQLKARSGRSDRNTVWVKRIKTHFQLLGLKFNSDLPFSSDGLCLLAVLFIFCFFFCLKCDIFNLVFLLYAKNCFILLAVGFFLEYGAISEHFWSNIMVPNSGP